jgi:aspartate racemase
LFEKALGEDVVLVYPSDAVQRDVLMQAVYGPRGIKAGRLRGESIDFIQRACRDVIDQGAEIIVPGFTEIPIVIDPLRSACKVPIVDCNQVYADYAIAFSGRSAARPHKIGVVGGVGPAATVDFMDKVVRLTRAERDQDHIKMIVEHNPQIPDRTRNLIGDGPDPTIPLYSACRKLEAEGADMIAIPCNTAHAFVERIQRHLSIPIVHMLYETVGYIQRRFPDRRSVGLLATSGTVGSRVYHEILEGAGLRVVAPDATRQDLVMRAIYGERGVKAGYTDGLCREDLLQALENVVRQRAEVVILGCTELPLILPQNDSLEVEGTTIALLDPTEILAAKCVELAGAHRK